jgi:hypothetical protein
MCFLDFIDVVQRDKYKYLVVIFSHRITKNGCHIPVTLPFVSNLFILVYS